MNHLTKISKTKPNKNYKYFFEMNPDYGREFFGFAKE
jgi:hypothetical protein